MEVAVSEIKKQEISITNYDELEKEFTEAIEKYKDLVLTEDNKTEIKDIKAKINKIIKNIDKVRIDKTKEYNEPLQKFIEQCNSLKNIGLVVVNNLDSQLKNAEQKEKADKLLEIVKYFDEHVGEYKNLIDFDNVYQEQWTNKTYTMKKVEQDIDHIFSKTKMDLTTIDGQITDENIRIQVKDYYFKNIKESSILSLALQEGNRIIENQKKIAEVEQKTENVNINAEIVNKTETEVNENVENVNNVVVNMQQEAVQQLDFRVWVTQEQKQALKEFLIKNNIEYGRVK